jgi:hypothetical protein
MKIKGPESILEHWRSLNMVKKGSQRMNQRLCVGYVTTKAVHIITRKSKSTKFMNKKNMKIKVKCTPNIKITVLSLTMRAV